jgi:alkanesulfonate monooxygenase SsuD/methylene tetrahydromethanopterin reductase-like flavin-dependent oxidoreductase (luciferase family)
VRHALLLDLAGPLQHAIALAVAAEAAGLDTVYAIEGGREAFVPLAAMATATSRIGLGSYVVNAFARTPWLTAMSALDLDELSGGRFVLGLGTGNRHINEWSHGVDSSRPLAKMREYVPVVRDVLCARAGELVAHDGAHHPVRWRAGRDPVRAAVPVVVAAAGPKMIELAGSLADGVGVGVLVSAEHLAEVIRPCGRDAAAAAGRDPDLLRFPMAAMVSVDDDEERARATARHAVCRLFHPVPHPYYDFLLRAQGFAAAADAAAALVPQGRVREAMEHIDDEIIDRLTISGTPATCAARLAEYDGLADEVICLDLRRPDPGDPLAASAGVFAMLALHHGGRRPDPT